jgi:hypothetical protein
LAHKFRGSAFLGYRTDLDDRAMLEPWALPGNLDRLGKVVLTEQEVSSDRLLRFGEWTVGANRPPAPEMIFPCVRKRQPSFILP